MNQNAQTTKIRESQFDLDREIQLLADSLGSCRPPHDIVLRAFEFAVNVVKLCRYLEKSRIVSPTLITQLLRAGTSVGANLEEGQAAQSRADFIHKNSISLKEARESGFWLRLILVTGQMGHLASTATQRLSQESAEIARIIGKIVVNARKSG